MTDVEAGLVMAEPRRWEIWVCPNCGEWDTVAWKCACGTNPQAIEVIEAAPVEAELERLRAENNGLYEQIAAAGEDVGEMEAEVERLRKIEAAAQAVVACMRGSYRSGQTTTTALTRAHALDLLREALGEPPDA